MMKGSLLVFSVILFVCMCVCWWCEKERGSNLGLIASFFFFFFFSRVKYIALLFYIIQWEKKYKTRISFSLFLSILGDDVGNGGWCTQCIRSLIRIESQTYGSWLKRVGYMERGKEMLLSEKKTCTSCQIEWTLKKKYEYYYNNNKCWCTLFIVHFKNADRKRCNRVLC